MDECKVIDEKLKNKFKKSLRQKLCKYNKLSFDDFIELKKILSNINNLLTKSLSLSFCKWLDENKMIDSKRYVEK